MLGDFLVEVDEFKNDEVLSLSDLVGHRIKFMVKEKETDDGTYMNVARTIDDEFDIQGGDGVTIREEGDKIVIEKPISREDLAEGYRRCAEQQQAIADEMKGVSREADVHLGDSPTWEE